jgi:hypothetical protein
MNGIKTGDKYEILINSNAMVSDFSNPVKDIVITEGKEKLYNIVDSWFGNNGIIILDSIIEMGQELGENIFSNILEYKITKINVNKNVAMVTLKMVNINSNANIKLVKINNEWKIDYKYYKYSFISAIIKNSSIDLLKSLLNIGGIL